jgi:hypothetical protein
MEGWRQRRNRFQQPGTKEYLEGGSTRAKDLPFPPTQWYASRPPVKASLRLAPLGLDRARPRCQRIYSKEGMAGFVLAGPQLQTPPAGRPRNLCYTPSRFNTFCS